MALQTKKYIELEDLSSYFDEKYHQNYLYDKLGADLHFYQWHKNKAYPELDSNGNRAGASQIWLKEYLLDANGEKVKPDRLSFWDYSFKKYICESDSSFFYFYAGYDLSSHPEWFKEIYLEICTQFSNVFEDKIVVVLNDY